MPTERQVLRSQRQVKPADDEQQIDALAAAVAARCPSPSSNSTPANPTGINDLIRALEKSTPVKKKKSDGAKKSTKTKKANASNSKAKKSQTAGKKRQGAVSRDENNSQKKRSKKSSSTDEAHNTDVVSLEDCKNTIDNAVSEERIDEKKAARLHECLQAGNWSEIAYSLLCEQIPMKRRGKGYVCRVCLVPKKGHICPYCQVCSTTEEKFKKGDEHVCINCPTCFEMGKKKKKLIQIKCEGHQCPHGPLEPTKPSTPESGPSEMVKPSRESKPSEIVPV